MLAFSVNVCVGSRSRKGSQMMNKSMTSSHVDGGEDPHAGDPEFSKDFSKAYQLVRHSS